MQISDSGVVRAGAAGALALAAAQRIDIAVTKRQPSDAPVELVRNLTGWELRRGAARTVVGYAAQSTLPFAAAVILSASDGGPARRFAGAWVVALLSGTVVDGTLKLRQICDGVRLMGSGAAGVPTASPASAGFCGAAASTRSLPAHSSEHLARRSAGLASQGQKDPNAHRNLDLRHQFRGDREAQVTATNSERGLPSSSTTLAILLAARRGPANRKPRRSGVSSECRRRDSNPRHADYDSAALTS